MYVVPTRAGCVPEHAPANSNTRTGMRSWIRAAPNMYQLCALREFSREYASAAPLACGLSRWPPHVTVVSCPCGRLPHAPRSMQIAVVCSGVCRGPHTTERCSKPHLPSVSHLSLGSVCPSPAVRVCCVHKRAPRKFSSPSRIFSASARTIRVRRPAERGSAKAKEAVDQPCADSLRVGFAQRRPRVWSPRPALMV